MGWLNAFCVYLTKVATRRGFVTQPQGKSKTIKPVTETIVLSDLTGSEGTKG